MGKNTKTKNKFDFLVFGAGGMQGQIVIQDLLSRGYKIFASDFYQSHIDYLKKKFPKLKDFKIVDLRKKKQVFDLIKKVKPFLVINCAELDWNINMYKACLKNKTNVIDLGADEGKMTEEQLSMDKAFKKAKTLIISGCGSTPGVNNIMLSYAAKKMDSIDTVEVGFAWNSNIKEFVAPFSMDSVFDEFSCFGTYMENGKWKKIKSSESVKEKEYREIGKNKCFLSRHPEPFTFHHYFKDKGLKNIRFWAGFPEHSFSAVSNLIALGFHDRNEMEINGVRVKPVEVTTEVVRIAQRPKGYTENEVLWVEATGKKDGQDKKILMECLVDTQPGWEDAGCNIDTGIPCAIVARMLREGKITGYGSYTPEAIVPPEEFFKALKEKKMRVYENGKLIN